MKIQNVELQAKLKSPRHNSESCSTEKQSSGEESLGFRKARAPTPIISPTISSTMSEKRARRPFVNILPFLSG